MCTCITTIIDVYVAIKLLQYYAFPLCFFFLLSLSLTISLKKTNREKERCESGTHAIKGRRVIMAAGNTAIAATANDFEKINREKILSRSIKTGSSHNHWQCQTAQWSDVFTDL